MSEATIDFGNLADWVAAFGSAGAVIAALVLAGKEQRRADRAERRALKEEQRKFNELIDWLDAMARQARLECDVGVDVSAADKTLRDCEVTFMYWQLRLENVLLALNSGPANDIRDPATQLALMELRRLLMMGVNEQCPDPCSAEAVAKAIGHVARPLDEILIPKIRELPRR